MVEAVTKSGSYQSCNTSEIDALQVGARVHSICQPMVKAQPEGKPLSCEAKEQTPPERLPSEAEKQYVDHWFQESPEMSAIVGRKVSHIDVLILFIELLKLDDASRSNEKIARRQERNQQIEHMKLVAENFKSQGKWQLMTNIGGGILSIIAGASPILGATAAGDWIQGKLTSTVLKGMKDLDKPMFFKQMGKITQSFSDIYKGTGDINRTFSEGNRSWDQHISDMARTDAEECTRTLDELLRQWNTLEDWLFQVLRMEHDTATKDYR